MRLPRLGSHRQRQPATTCRASEAGMWRTPPRPAVAAKATCALPAEPKRPRGHRIRCRRLHCADTHRRPRPAYEFAMPESDLPSSRQAGDLLHAVTSQGRLYGAASYRAEVTDDEKLGKRIRAMYLRDMRSFSANLADDIDEASKLLDYSYVRVTSKHYRTRTMRFKAMR